MNLLNSLPKFLSRAFLTAGALALAISAHAGLQVPYTSDPDTMHLWHLDETNGANSVDAVATDPNPSTNAIPITLTNIGEPNPGVGPYTNSFFGAISFFPELGTCYAGVTKQNLLYGGTFADVSQFRNPTSGAFTFEALVKLETAFSGADIEILSGDNGDAITQRGWQWRIEQGTMEWDLLGGGTDNDFKATLPTSGPDSVATNVWYHAAISYTGQSPTNGDTPNIITMYWTLMDGARTNADVLNHYTATRPLDGSPEGATTPNLGIWGSARSLTNPGNNEGGIGSIDEVRVSDIARAPFAMAFTNNGVPIPPVFLQEPPVQTLAAYGGTLTINASVSASSPTFTWLQYTTTSTNVVPGQSSSSLSVTNITFANGGSYVLIVSNSINVVTSTVAQVTIGASPTGLFSTGVDSNGVVSAPDIPDIHYTLIESQDSSFLGPDAMVFEWNTPIEFAVNNGSYAPTNGSSIWIGDEGNAGGVYYNSVPGTYVYRTTILMDQVNPSTVSLQATFFCNGVLSNLLINGQSTGLSLAGGSLYLSYFTISNYNNVLFVTAGGASIASQSYAVTNTTSSPWFLPGLNTLDFVENVTSGGSAILVESPTAIGQALPPGLPSILDQPVSQTVRDANLTGQGSEAQFSVVATGRSPLSYQWWVDGSPLVGATNRTFDIDNPTAGGQGTNYSVIVANGSGSVTSAVVVLDVVSTNQSPIAPTVNIVSYAGEGGTVEISDLTVLVASDPDGDPVTFDYADGSSTNGGSISQVNEGLVYNPPLGYVGPDQFSYTVSDSLGAATTGYIDIQNLLSPIPASQAVPPGVAVTYNVGVTNPPAGFAFQWKLNGINVPGATTGLLVITNAQVANSGSYVLVATDPSGVQWPSPAAQLTVEAYPPYMVPVASIIDSSEQSGYPAANAVDGTFSDFWVSYGTVAGQNPTPASPEWLFVTFPRVVALSEFLVYPRLNYGPEAVQMLVNCTLAPGTPVNGTETNGIPTNGTSIYTGTMNNTSPSLDVVLAKPVYITNAELYITSSYSADNVQVEQLVFNERAAQGTFGDWELGLFTAAQLNSSASTSPFADPDGDHVLNLQEFAVGGNPLVKDATNAAMAAVILPGDEIGLQYKVRNQLGDVSLQFQASSNLVTWTNVSPTTITQITNLGTVSIDQAVFPQQPPLQYYRIQYGLTNVLRY